jgi:hypothetical protein
MEFKPEVLQIAPVIVPKVYAPNRSNTELYTILTTV